MATDRPHDVAGGNAGSASLGADSLVEKDARNDGFKLPLLRGSV